MLIPKLLPTPFAEEGRKNTIPQVKPADAGAHLASFELGFPPITMQPKADGGLPPDGMDVNGILYETTSHISYLNKGGQYKFNEEYSNLIGGYPKGAILLSDDETKQYISVSENNKDNFNDALIAKWKVISLADIDVLLNDKVSSQTMADALNLKLDKTTYATLTQRGITQLTNTIDDSEDKAVTPKGIKESLDKLTPVGTVHIWLTDTAPEGYLFAKGQTFSKTQYPKLAQLFPSLRLPDFRGVVPRGLDDGRGFDSGRVLGSYQEDAMQKITGSIGTGSGGVAITPPGEPVGALKFDGGGSYIAHGGDNTRAYIMSFDSSLVTRTNTQNETVMKNIATNFIIKAG